MARKNSSSALALTGAAVSVVVVSGLVGYYVLGGAHPAPQNATVPIVEQAPPPSVPRTVHPTGPRSKSADYSAPGSPQIAISEDKSPTIVDATHSHDAEASQAGTSIPTPDTEVPQPNDNGASTSSSPTNTSSPASNSNGAPGGSTGSTDTSSGSDSIPPPPGDTTHTPSPQPSPKTTIKAPPGTTAKSNGSSDHDFEQISSTSPHAGDSEASQSGGPLYRVQTGSFADERNARILAATLSNQGFTTSIRSVTEGGKSVYKVQVGAYRSQSAANKAVSDLQRGGYPAYISTGKS